MKWIEFHWTRENPIRENKIRFNNGTKCHVRNISYYLTLRAKFREIVKFRKKKQLQQ